jgi:hypothetical protein
MKQTAVEWLYNELTKVWYDVKSSKQLLKQAKEMERQQMKDSGCPYIGGWEDDEFEYWYNETYKNKKQ